MTYHRCTSETLCLSQSVAVAAQKVDRAMSGSNQGVTTRAALNLARTTLRQLAQDVLKLHDALGVECDR